MCKLKKSGGNSPSVECSDPKTEHFHSRTRIRMRTIVQVIDLASCDFVMAIKVSYTATSMKVYRVSSRISRAQHSCHRGILAVIFSVFCLIMIGVLRQSLLKR